MEFEPCSLIFVSGCQPVKHPHNYYSKIKSSVIDCNSYNIENRHIKFYLRMLIFTDTHTFTREQ